jgi:hypothetical protein
MRYAAFIALALLATPASAQVPAADPASTSVSEERAQGAAKARRDGDAYERRAAERHRAWENRARTVGEIPTPRAD